MGHDAYGFPLNAIVSVLSQAYCSSDVFSSDSCQFLFLVPARTVKIYLQCRTGDVTVLTRNKKWAMMRMAFLWTPLLAFSVVRCTGRKLLARPGPVNRKPGPARPGPSMPSPQKTHTRQTTACTPWSGHLLDKNFVTRALDKDIYWKTQLFVTVHILLILLVIACYVFNCALSVFN